MMLENIICEPKASAQMAIQRFPNRATLLRGPNIKALFCQGCCEEKTHGYKFYDPEINEQSFFVCDECLKAAKKAAA